MILRSYYYRAVRYPPEHKRAARERILDAAARCFRSKGYVASGVDEVMKRAGLTAGAFYAHFESKEALLADVLGASLGVTRALLFSGLEDRQGSEWLAEVVRRYLSRTHRDAAGEGCSLPSLTVEVARQSDQAREVFESHLRTLVAEVADKIPAAPELSPEDRALATLALMAGGIVLARAVKDQTLSDRILRACRRLAVPEVAPRRKSP